MSLTQSGSHPCIFKLILQRTRSFSHSPTAAILSAEALRGVLLISCPEERVGEAVGVEKGHRKQIRCPLMPCCQLHETWEFDLPCLIRTAESLLILCWRSDWIPKGIIKGSFLQEVPHITLPPLNHICSAISSSSTCSNFALEKKISLCWAFSLFSRFLLLRFHPELTETSFSSSALYWWWSINWSSPCCCIFCNMPHDKLNRHLQIMLVNAFSTE